MQKTIKEQPKDEVIIIKPTQMETAKHLTKPIFGTTPREYAEKLITEQQKKDVNNDNNIKLIIAK